jgi:gluconokinase
VDPTPARIIICMGVSSSGKTVTGEAIAQALTAPFLDGDGFHPYANKEKMRAGTPLTDNDRWPWLGNLAHALHAAADRDGIAVGACSALKRTYRDYLRREAGEPILFVFLQGSQTLIAARIAARQHEYMPASLLPSQFATLEIPGEDENVIAVDISLPLEAIVTEVAETYRNLVSR